jgi:hypothetical protein
MFYACYTRCIKFGRRDVHIMLLSDCEFHENLRSESCSWIKLANEAVPWPRRLVAGLSTRKPGFGPGSVRVGFMLYKVAMGQFFPRVLGVSPVSFISPVLHYLEKRKKKRNNIYHRVAQYVSRLRCVRSICCGALHKKNSPMTLYPYFPRLFSTLGEFVIRDLNAIFSSISEFR